MQLSSDAGDGDWSAFIFHILESGPGADLIKGVYTGPEEHWDNFQVFQECKC